MPEFFRSEPPSDQRFFDAYAFMKSATNSTQRGVAKRWISSHLSDMEYALKPVEWDLYPRCSAHYKQQGFDFDDDVTMLRSRWAQAVGLMRKDDEILAGRVDVTAPEQGI